MPPKLAALLTVGFIVFLFRRDIREKPNVTGALWLPTIWLFIIISKTFTQWLTILGLPNLSGSRVEEGSSIDAIVFMGLIALGIHVLVRRQIRLSEVVANNPWLLAFIAYCLISILWSDLPFVSFKRWIKILGHPVMVLIVFTEPDPEEALVRLMKRCAYLAFPISILWMKYYPALGRKATDWGAMSNVGVAGGKNELGGLCLIFALFFFWHLLSVWRTAKSRQRRQELYLVGGLLLMIAFCLGKAHSATSDLSLLLGALTIILLGLRFVNKQFVGVYAVAAIIALIIAQITFDFYGNVVDLSGHENTIEGRGRLWEFLLASNENPILGTGFESYWLGERAQKIWAMAEYRWHPTQAHNGYLELYLNLGIVGLLIFAGLVCVTFQKCKGDLLTNLDWGRLTLGFLVAILAHNWTEAGFKGLGLIFFAFFIIAMNVPELQGKTFALSAKETRTEEEAEFFVRRMVGTSGEFLEE